MLSQQKYPNAQNFFKPNLSTQTQEFGIFEIKSLWVSVVRGVIANCLNKAENNWNSDELNEYRVFGFKLEVGIFSMYMYVVF